MRQATIKIRFSATVQLLLANVVLFIIQSLTGGTQGWFTQLLLINGTGAIVEPWRLLTGMFLHGSFAHLLFNMYALFIFGPLVEQRIGTRRFLYLYFGAGLLASLAALFYPSALGASGAVMGVIGAVIVLFPDLKVLFFFIIPMSMRTAGIIFALIDLIGLFNPSSNIAHAAHLAGLALGLIYAWYLRRKGARYRQRFAGKTSGFQSSTARGKTRSKSRSGQNSYENTIELNKDELDEFYKSGKL